MSDEINQSLHDLAHSNHSRTSSARLKDYLADIDAAISKGVRIDVIEKTLAEFGLDVTSAALRGALYRFRQHRKSNREAPDQEKPAERPHVDASPFIPPASEISRPTDSNPSPSPKPSGYKSDLSAEESAILRTLSTSEKIAFFRSRESRRKFTHNPTPERFRKNGE